MKNEQININLSSEFENNLQYAILNAPTNFKDPTSLTNEKSDLADKIENIIKNGSSVLNVGRSLSKE